MGYIIMAYAADGYEEYILPDVNDANYEILLKRNTFSLTEDVTVFLEIVDGKWKFIPQREYQVYTDNRESGFSKVLEDGLVLELHVQRQKITLVVLLCKAEFPVFHKYSIAHINQLTLGKDDGNTIRYDFRGFISRNHAVLYRYGEKWVVQDNSSNGTYLNGKRVQGQEYLQFGDRITLFGLRIVFLESLLAVCALSGEYQINDTNLAEYYPRENLKLSEEKPEAEKKVYFKRAPRTVEKLYTDDIEIEAPPQFNKTKKRPLLLTIGPSFTMAIPMLLGCAMSILGVKSRGGSGGVYMFTGVITAVSSALIGVIWALTNLRYASREEEENEEIRFNAYGKYLIDITNFIKEKYDSNKDILFRTYLSGQECCGFSRGDVRLWNHNDKQEDFLVVRLGTGTIPFQADIKIPKKKFEIQFDELSGKPALIRDSYQNLLSVPVCIDIWRKGMIGVIGGANKAGAYLVAYNMIAQLAANTCYTDLKMVFIYRQHSENGGNWSFAKWLPHVWSEDHKTRLIASDKAELGDICYELANVLRRRTEEQTGRKEYPLPHYVIFVDDMELMQGELLERFIYNPRPEYGITTILLAEKYEDLPNSCEEIIQNDGRTSCFFHVSDEEERSKDLVFESVSKSQLEQLARRLCDVEVNEVTGNGEIPNSLDFFEMYGVSTLEELQVLDRWKKNRNYENMRVPIGQKNGGSVCYLDIHEKYHGPHGLVAGTTGSGKSETLQTYILSLAVNFSPDDIAFFIIDFKGGGMANLFSGLPHMAGQISNLSGNQVRRAMISIKSENMRRQRIFAQHNVNNINLYTKLYKKQEAELPIPHLFIIIDEFAELKREEPEFMKELISVAQVGRSLGVHLILATQKPSGTVDDNIWSNSKFRLCLRVQDKQDSNDMLHKPDAAYITQAGRGYLQVGNDEIYEQFQSGYSGAEYIDDPKQNKAASAVMMTLNGRPVMTGADTRRKRSADVKAKTQLDAVIDYLACVAEQYHYDRKMLLWLPVLPQTLYLEELVRDESWYRNGEWSVHSGAWKLETVVGLYDDPANQAQEPLHVNFTEGGHLAVCGMVATGKSTFLQTFLYAMIQQYSPKELNFYVLDYSSRMLLPFENAPHCGGVMIDTDEEKVKKFFFMLNDIMKERKLLFKGGNYSQYLQANRNKDTLPAILAVIDNYANFREKTGNQFDEEMLRISREGVGYGIFLVITAAGFGSNEIPGRVNDNIRTVISLEMGDKFKYSELLRTTRVEILPETDVKGRGLAYVHGNILEFQTALSVKAEDAYERTEIIEAKCRDMNEAWKGAKARKIPMIPEQPVFHELIEKEEYIRAQQTKRFLPMGYLAQDASVYSVDLWNHFCYIIQGKSRSGKKNVLKTLLYAAAKKENAEVYLIDLKGRELKNTAEQLSVTYLSDEESVYEFFKTTVPVFKERNVKKRELMGSGIEQEELAEQMNQEKRFFIFIADMTAFIQAVYHPADSAKNMRAYLENISEKGSCHGFYFFGILNPDESIPISGYRVYQNMISYKTGIHLGGNISAQRLFQFSNIPFQEQTKTTKPGVGLVPNTDDNGMAQKVVLPLVKGGFS